jgi:hypothetical protein
VPAEIEQAIAHDEACLVSDHGFRIAPEPRERIRDDLAVQS